VVFDRERYDTLARRAEVVPTGTAEYFPAYRAPGPRVPL
jgi:hypothetical protein